MKSKKNKSHTVSKLKTVEKYPHLGIATTLKAAASMTGLTITVLKILKASGSKAFKANGRVDCDLAKEDAAKLPPMKVSGIDFHEEQALTQKVERMLKEQKLAERGKTLVQIETVRRAAFRNVIACKTKLYSAENTIAVEAGMKLSLAPEAIAGLREIIKKHFRPAIKELHQGEYGQVICPECKKEIAP